MPPHLENGTIEQIVSHIEKEFERNRLETPDELQMKTLTQHATKSNPEKPKPTCHHCKKPKNSENLPTIRSETRINIFGGIS